MTVSRIRISIFACIYALGFHSGLQAQQLSSGNGTELQYQVAGGGTAFFVDTDVMFTAAHVLRMKTEDGTETFCDYVTDKNLNPLQPISYDYNTDLAILRSPYKSPAYFEIEQRKPWLGEEVFVLGYPFLFTLGSELSVNRGSLSRASGPNDNPIYFTVDAAMSSGNSGGPTINENGAVVGISSFEWDNETCKAQTKRECEGFNFIVNQYTMLDFMRKSGFTYVDTRRQFDPRRGLPPSMQPAVMPVYCIDIID